jgi:hypothetical protein
MAILVTTEQGCPDDGAIYRSSGLAIPLYGPMGVARDGKESCGYKVYKQCSSITILVDGLLLP